MIWIDVNDRMPERYGEYMTMFSDGKMRVYDYTAVDQKRKRWQLGIGQHVTHWMPLPEPPK